MMVSALSRLPVAWMIGAVMATAAVGPAYADEATAPAATATVATATVGATEPADPEPWRFRATAYAWLINASGNVTARGQTVDYSANFLQLVQKSDSIAAWMSYFEASKGKAGLYADFVWTRVGFSNSTASYRNPIGGLQLSSVANQAVAFSLTIVEMGGTYEVAHWSGSEGSRTAVDAVLGFRYWNTVADLSFDRTNNADFSRLGFDVTRSFAIAHSGGLSWIDPLIGVRLRHQFTPRQELLVRGDIGGFGLQSTFAWQAVAGYSYQWALDRGAVAAVIGYRALSTNYSTGSGLDTRGLDILLHGPIIGASLRF